MAKFSKQHYQAVATILTDVKAGLDKTSTMPMVVDIIVERLADLFEHDNSRFSREHFLAVVRGERPVNSRPPRS